MYSINPCKEFSHPIPDSLCPPECLVRRILVNLIEPNSARFQPGTDPLHGLEIGPQTEAPSP